MKKVLTYSLILTTFAFSFSGCKKDSSGGSGPTNNAAKIAADGFKFETTSNVSLNLSLKAPNNDALPGVVVSVYDPSNVKPGAALFKGVTDKSGNLKASLNVASSLKTLVIDPDYIGLIKNATANIVSNNITATIGGKDGFSGSIVAAKVTFSNSEGSGSKRVDAVSTIFGFPSPYTSLASAVLNTATYPANLGRPAYLQATGDVIPASLLAFVNASLPGGQNLAITHPAYLANNISSIINVTAASDVYVTFVSEGATFTSTIAYYTYPTNNPPKTAADIKNATYVFPNASAYGSGGAMYSGDKVKLGTFAAGTSIGYMLLQNAFQGTSINTSVPLMYGQDSFNAGGLRQAVTLYDDVDKLFLTGFEDLTRAGDPIYPSDNDFNDVVIYTTCTTPSAISTGNTPIIDKGGDTDGDGVPNASDAFPNDPTKAYITYYPAQNAYSQIAFEDNWPKKGDYDLNDLVVNCRYTFVNNAQNQCVTVQGDFSVAAAGATYQNGFGVQIPVSASLVKSVTGQKSISNYIQFAANGVEAGQTNAVIIPFDNYKAVINNADGSSYINTYMNKDKVTSTTASVLVTFNSPVTFTSNFNPFLISNLRRGYEIHLPGYLPTDKADKTLFGTFDDASKTKGVNYVGTDNGPWAILFPGTFSYPTELTNISAAYPHFLDWALSGGSGYSDWYSNTAAGYRDNSKIYSK